MTTTNQLTFTPGKDYRRRDGLRWRCYAVDGGPEMPIHGATFHDDRGWLPEARLKDGTAYLGVESHLDIIAEWKDAPVVDWSKMPAWANWVAMDENKKWFWFICEPVRVGRDHWSNSVVGEDIGQIPASHIPAWTGDWRDSLVERPQP